MKLVRDKIPEIMKAKGQDFSSRTATKEEYERLIKLKLREEVAEYLHDEKPEELADILEVILALAKAKNITQEQLESIRKKKRDKRGGFDKGILLEAIR